MAGAITTCRRKLQARVPRGFELVYDNYNALAISQPLQTVVKSVAAHQRERRPLPGG